MNQPYNITVFTPTYNRAHTLPALYKSLVEQITKHTFEWLVIDDGSSDNTEELVKQWICENRITINYHKVANGGKPRAINRAVGLAQSPFLFIVDSDDYLADNTVIDFMANECQKIKDDNSFVGVGGLRGYTITQPFKQPLFANYVDATDLERAKYGLNFDCNEVYKINILRQYPFIVWEGENFTPEQIVLDDIALDGYKLRWHNRVIVISEYLDDGLTKGSWNLVKKNPMGYAMLYNHKLRYHYRIKDRIHDVVQLVAQSLLGNVPLYFLRSNAPILAGICYPIGVCIAIRRRIQYRKA
ncbi:MAG: glycosyltransferase family 2 protein [Rikenellaceae bacterium]|nr:glycosyltransferase family 2 protein [Rikenellaceae bacterium]MBQ5719424.1 glycosyltransferase family 2 protein [Alistipes sp.]